MTTRLPKRASAAACAIAAAALSLAAPSRAATPAHFYVALGDSLAVGMQPDSSGTNRPTDHGYVDGIARRIERNVTGLGVVKLGCPGETTTSMLGGGSCSYVAGSQLAQAQAFLRAHRGATRLVTVDIGDNDVESCIAANATINAACVSREMAAVRSNLPKIASALRAAAGRQTPVVGVSDYDQFLAFWLRGTRGRTAARRSVQVVEQLNATVDRIYARADVSVADAAPRFATRQLKRKVALEGHGRVPVAVARICRWTWACSPPPIGFNDHANAVGYAVIAATVESTLAEIAPHLVARGG
jgi:lysophospholipase L1-like esterase